MSILDTIKKKMKPGAEKSASVAAPKEKRAQRPVKAAAKKETESPKGISVGSRKSGYDLLAHPYVTEKSSALKAQGNKYVFVVAKEANKIQVRKAIQEKYKVTVTKMNMINIPSKTVQVGRTRGTKSGFRKAIITLKEGQSIESGV